MNQRIVLNSRPVGAPKPENFRLEDCPLPSLEVGQVLLKTEYLSLDPYMRGRMSDACFICATSRNRRSDGGWRRCQGGGIQKSGL